jgi:hypothetical protein
MWTCAARQKEAMMPTHKQQLQLLDQYVMRAAKDVIPFIQACNRGGYAQFLNTMYHYTLTSEQQLRQAAEKSHDDALREYFLHQAKEERGHYLLAKRDMEGIGGTLKPAPSAPVLAYRAYWEEIPKERAAAYLGAVYVFENVALYVAKDVIDMMRRLELQKKETRWLSVHLEADVQHGKEAAAICERYLPRFKDTIFSGAETFSVLWSNIFKEAFQEEI